MHDIRWTSTACVEHAHAQCWQHMMITDFDEDVARLVPCRCNCHVRVLLDTGQGEGTS